MTELVLAIDQGTTSTRAMAFDATYATAASAQEELPQHYPASGWVEHDPEDIWQSTLSTARMVLEAVGGPQAIATIGITNQRETVLLWERRTGKPLGRAIVWQDRRTADKCAKLAGDGLEPMIAAKTGLLIDPYFSATKLAWMLDHVEGARGAAEAGKLAFGTVDSFLIWRLTGGKVHATDATNASRTLMFDIHRQQWDDDLLRAFNIPRAVLPEVRDSSAHFGDTDAGLFGRPLAIRGVAGDQQAATIGQACFTPGMVKATHGTGSFIVLNTGAKAVSSRNRLLTTVAYRLGGVATYALEGSIFVSGAAVQWLRDGLGIIERAEQSGELAAQADGAQEVVLVPAFTGLGAPHWDANARGALYGLTRATGPCELARAALESVCFQTHDLIEAMRRDWPGEEAPMVLRVDGGMVASDWTMQRLADILDAPVDRPHVLETTALGAAWLAGRHAGLWPDMEGFARSWKLDRRFEAQMPPRARAQKIAAWRDAVRRTLSAPG